MNNIPQHILDEHLRSVSETAHFPFREDAWEAMDDMLTAQDRRRKTLYGGLALLLLLLAGTAGWWYLGTDNTNAEAILPDTVVDSSATTAAPANEIDAAVVATEDPVEETTDLSVDESESSSAESALPTTGISASTAASTHKIPVNSAVRTEASQGITRMPKNVTATVSATPLVPTTSSVEPTLPSEQLSTAVIDERNTQLLASLAQLPVTALPETVPGPLTLPPLTKPARPQPGRWSLNVFVGAEGNGASGPTEATGLNTRLGFRIDYALTNKLTLGAGLAHGRRDYCTAGGNYTAKPGFWVAGVKPESVDCEMRITELPIALRYYAKGRIANGFYFGAGLNSYRMDRETYTFNYDPDNTPTDAILDWEERGTASHYLGIATFTAGYQTALRDRLQLRIAPYYHLPLQGVGIGQIELQTFGIQVETSFLSRKE